MKIEVLYFANIKELLDVDREEVHLPHGQNVADLCRQLAARGGQWQAVFSPAESALKVAINQELSDWHQELKEGDEVAFFPPVTGG